MLRRAPPDWDAMVSSTVMLGGMVVDLKCNDDSKEMERARRGRGWSGKRKEEIVK